MTTESLSKCVKELLEEFETSSEVGLSTDVASERRRRSEQPSGARLTPPWDCPAWACVLLPCINHLPSMKLFRQICPDDAEVLRDGNWVCYDAASLVKGDVIRLAAGDIVPADCIILKVEEQLSVDHQHIVQDERKPRLVPVLNITERIPLYCGGRCLEGSANAVVTAVGNQTLLASLIRKGKWPLPTTKGNKGDENDEQNSLLETTEKEKEQEIV